MRLSKQQGGIAMFWKRNNIIGGGERRRGRIGKGRAKKERATLSFHATKSRKAMKRKVDKK